MHFRTAVRPGRSVVSGGGWIRDKTAWTIDRDYGSYALVLLTAGDGRYADAAGADQTVQAGDALLIFPGLRHRYGPDIPGRWSELWLGFDGPVFAALEADGVIARDRPVLHPGIDPALVAKADAVLAMIDRRHGIADAALVAQVHALLVEIAGRTGGEEADLVARARAELDADLPRAIDLPALAGRLGIGYDTLRRAFLRHLGTTPGHWRLLRRIERAKTLLVAGASMEEIAAATGFCDRFFFARQFRKVVGLPPGRWRDLEPAARGR